MCIFVAPVRSVRKTRILVAPIPDNAQLTVYENQVQSSTKNAMVLPVPSGSNIKLLDLSHYRGNIWDQCERLLPQEMPMYGFGAGFGAASLSFGASEPPPPLPVERVGGYSCTIVPTIGDFPRVANEVFKLPADIEAILRQNYSQGFSFIVALFDGDVAAHPIGYVSARLSNGQCFIPTRHAHGSGVAFHPGTTVGGGGVVHAGIHCDHCRAHPIQGSRWKCIQCPDFDLCNACYMNNQAGHDQAHFFLHMPRPAPVQGFQFGSSAPDDFDHTLYLINAVLVASPKRYDDLKLATISGRGGFRAPPFDKQLPMPAELECITRVDIKGNYPNGDYTCAPVQ